MTSQSSHPLFPHRHLLGIRALSPADIELLLDRADIAVALSRQSEKKTSSLRGRTQINLFYEASTRTQASFEMAGKRLSADVMNMNVATSSVTKGETLVDTAVTLNAMRPSLRLTTETTESRDMTCTYLPRVRAFDQHHIDDLHAQID